MCCSRSFCRSTASFTLSWQCPTLTVTIPPKSCTKTKSPQSQWFDNLRKILDQFLINLSTECQRVRHNVISSTLIIAEAQSHKLDIDNCWRTVNRYQITAHSTYLIKKACMDVKILTIITVALIYQILGGYSPYILLPAQNDVAFHKMCTLWTRQNDIIKVKASKDRRKSLLWLCSKTFEMRMSSY